MLSPPPHFQQLHITFPKWPGWDMQSLSMSRLSVHTLPSLELDLRPYAQGCHCGTNRCTTKEIPQQHEGDTLNVTVDSASHDDYSSDSPVFHATTTSYKPLALKFALREDLIPGLFHEAHVYSAHLDRVQGRAVPWYWGFFVGTSTTTGERVACLALEYWGEALPVRFCDLQQNLRMFILTKLEDIHRCGVHHGDFAERNILYSEANGLDIRIIDFDQTVAHTCREEQGACDLIQQVGRDMEVGG